MQTFSTVMSELKEMLKTLVIILKYQSHCNFGIFFIKWGLEYKLDNGEPIRNVRSKFYRATGNGRPGVCAQARPYYGEFFQSPQI